ncbi:MAG TPA: isoprenylcysteine carboxylmethyltransferase family protein [Terriglobales bacterium]|nr:isoprenylcysteine carboxylmethyltransferase family protein [Terriglobales bacterium]
MAIRNILLTLVAGGAAAYAGWQLAPAIWTPLQVLGLCLAVAGFILWAIARFQLGSSFTIRAQAKQLVTRGVYSKIRNPIYVFGSVFIAGYILLLGRPVWLLIFVGLIPLQIRRARKEAQVLEAKFGEEYRAYSAQTWF